MVKGKTWSHASAEVVKGRLVAEAAHTLTMFGECECDIEYVAELVVVGRLGVLQSFAFCRLNANSVRTCHFVAVCATHRQVEDGLPKCKLPLILPALRVGS